MSVICTLVRVDSGSSASSVTPSLSGFIVVSVIVVSVSFANDSDSLGRHLRLIDVCEDFESLVLSIRTPSVVDRSI